MGKIAAVGVVVSVFVDHIVAVRIQVLRIGVVPCDLSVHGLDVDVVRIVILYEGEFDIVVICIVDLFLELFVLTRRRGEPYRSAATRVIDRWLELAVPALVSMGVPARRAPGTVAAALAQLDGGILLQAAGATDAQLAAVRKAGIATIEAARV